MSGLNAENLIQELANQLRGVLMPEFAPSPVPMKVASKVLGMEPDMIRNRMEMGILDIGIIAHSEKKRGTRAYRNTYISPKKFWELTGYVWRGEQNEE